jgi:hypothetical protein
VGTLEWLGEGHVLFTVPDAAGRPHQVPRRRTAFPQRSAGAGTWATRKRSGCSTGLGHAHDALFSCC